MAVVASAGATKQVDADVSGKRDRDQIATAEAAIKALGLKDDDLIKIYRTMLDIRHFEEQCNRAFRAGKIGGYLHLYIGQEAISTGVIDCLKQGDQVLSSYRDHAHCLALGSDPNAVMAEIMGRATGISRGKGGSMHLFDKPHGFAGGYGIVGGNVPLSLGIGWALKYQKTDNICVCYVGDGAMNAGAFHESLNMVSLYKLPVLYILENNLYAMGTSIDRSHANTDLSSRAESYAMPHSKVDGQDYFTVRKAVNDIVTKMRKDPYPYFLECETYRYVGHGAADDAKTQATYRTHDEVEQWRKRDPLGVIEIVLRARNLVDDAKVKEFDKAAIEYAHSAYDYADASPACSPEELYQDVYVA
ncbi:MAG TPA: pyruvate dehydrogenase (acetyl-transferring) E1 component subunit alpha [Capsulimonadaceae bacterium]|jgi:pyruvate dehydrogenase E1 component alpha subunit